MEKSSDLWATISLDARIYVALTAIDRKGLDPTVTYYLQDLDRTFRRRGVHLKEETRNEIRSLTTELRRIEREFVSNITAGRAAIQFTAEELEGVPADYLDRYPPDSNGRISLPNDRGDYQSVATHAKNPETRRRMLLHYLNRGHPVNQQTLAKMLSVRQRLARLSGFESHAAIQTDELMIGNVEALRKFIASVRDAALPAAERELAALLQLKRQEWPKAESLDRADEAYYVEQLRRSRLGVDVREARAYFSYEKVQDGILDVAKELFEIEFERVTGAKAWHPSVKVWNVREQGRLLGRIYLDMHPREGKYSHFALAPSRDTNS
ncbi:MAG: M3 family metallopeptidase [Bryobacteraceae bacterium]